MSQGISCKVAEHKPHWVVIQRNGNASAFNGYHWTPSDYSCVRCPLCPAHWRTKAAYVRTLPNAPEGWENAPQAQERPESTPNFREPGLHGETSGFLEDIHAKANAKSNRS